MQHGKEGAEILAQIINRVFKPIIEAVYIRGGFITGFAGDAFTVIFPHHNQSTALSACFTALAIHRVFVTHGNQPTKYGTFTLAVKQGISAGTVEWGVIGIEKQKNLLLSGYGYR